MNAEMQQTSSWFSANCCLFSWIFTDSAIRRKKDDKLENQFCGNGTLCLARLMLLVSADMSHFSGFFCLCKSMQHCEEREITYSSIATTRQTVSQTAIKPPMGKGSFLKFKVIQRAWQQWRGSISSSLLFAALVKIIENQLGRNAFLMFLITH